MPKPVIPPHDPARLARIQDEKLRMIGVDTEALNKQVQEKQAAKQREREQERASAAATCLQDKLLVDREAQACQARRMQERGVDAFRRKQEEERRHQEAQQRLAEQEASAAEQAAALGSPWLNEAHETTISAISRYRVRPDHFKGMTQEQRMAIVLTQAAQVQEKQSMEQRSMAEQAAHDAQQAAELAALGQKTAQAEAARRQQAAQVAAMQQKQAAEAKTREAELAMYLNSQQPCPEYFSQWGTSHR